MKEHSRQTIKCRTSPSRPKPNVNWYLQESTSSAKHKIAVNSSTRIISSIGDGLVAVENTLLFYPNRSINNWMLYCEGWTDNENRAVGSNKKIKMNITYHPDIPPTIFGFNNSKKYRLIESEVGKLSCSVYGGNPLPSLTWNCYNNKQTPNIIDGKTVFSNVTWTGSRNQTSCSCISYHSWSGITQTTTVTIDALYPPQKPIFAINGKGVSYVINVILNKTLQVMCESKSNPSPNYTWTGSLLSLRTAQVLVVTINDTYSRIYNCLAKNTMVRNNNTHVDGQNEANMTVKVLYPPEKLSFKYEYKNGTHANLDEMIDVIEEDSFTILCDAVGNPSPFIQWDGQTIKNVLKITSIMSDTNKTCTATNEMEETVGESRTGFTSATVLISVLYPPRIPTISISNGKRYINVTTSVQLTEKDSINMTCYSAANPKPNYTWASHNTKIQNNVRQFVDLSRTDTGSYTCNVNNMLRRTFGEAMSGSNFSSIFLNILYHSTILSIKDTSILEGSNLTVICHVQQGNPSEEFFSWTRLGDSKIWDGNQLIIDNVSREDDTNYTCSLTSRIIPTIGNETEMVIKRSFHLNVFFPTKIKYFSVGGRKNRETYIVNNMDDVSIECTAEGNPASNLSLSHLPGKSISTEESKNSLHHNITNASFENAGLYTCEGRNNYTIYRAPISRLILIVKSPPRPSPDSKFENKVAAALYTDKTLHFAAQEYLDEKNKTDFMWFKQNITVPRNDTRFEISSNGLYSNFSVRNITRTDFGEYRVKVWNSVGEYNQYYELTAEDKPDSPDSFTYFFGSVTESSVTLSLTPGFDGGFTQTFTILYQVSEENEWQSVSVKDTYNEILNYTLKDLLSAKVYHLKMFATNKLGNSSFTHILQVKTKPMVKTKAAPVKVGIIAGSVTSVVVVCVIVSILFVYIFFRKRKKNKSDRLYQNVPFIGNQVSKKDMLKRSTINEKETIFQDLQEVDDDPHILSESTEYTNSLEVIEHIERIQVPELFAYVFGRKDLLEAEYQKLPTGLQKPCTFARKPENIALNRYNGIYPYDHSRVKVQGNAGFFINACYIDGYKCSRKYIASLGPTSKTTNDFKTFWEMIWNEKSDLIVMLTNLREQSGMKCEQYWPNEGTCIQYGDVTVTNQGIEVFAEYTQRKFTVSVEDVHRSLTHLHYTAWPDKTVPEDVATLLEFRQKMRATTTTNEGPVLIHCSAGIGRTGTLIAIDRLIEEGMEKDSVNVFECVKRMREQRVKMVQTQEQYVYIHKALVVALTFRSEAITIEAYHDYFAKTNANTYNMLFQQLKQAIETDSEAEEKARSRNKGLVVKNHRGADIPGNRFRIFLHLCRGEEESDYINAVYINSFKQKDHFIAAQSPLSSTVADFLTMIYQDECSCIVAMEDPNEQGMAVGKYLPEENKTLSVGHFEVVCSRLETKQSYVIRKMKIKYSGKFETGEKSIIHFQYTKWPAANEIPVNASEFVQFANESEEYAYELGEERSRVIAHCLKANEKSCLFCAVVILMEKMKYERQVNVIETLRHLRTRRRSAITSQKQLEFCYQAIDAFNSMSVKKTGKKH